MKTFLEICAEIEIGKREIAVTILAGAANSEPTAETRTFGTTTRELTECAEWLRTGGCSTVVMESTGSYWLPVWNVLHTGFALNHRESGSRQSPARREDRCRRQPMARGAASRGRRSGQLRAARQSSRFARPHAAA